MVASWAALNTFWGLQFLPVFYTWKLRPPFWIFNRHYIFFLSWLFFVIKSSYFDCKHFTNHADWENGLSALNCKYSFLTGFMYLHYYWFLINVPIHLKSLIHNRIAYIYFTIKRSDIFSLWNIEYGYDISSKN